MGFEKPEVPQLLKLKDRQDWIDYFEKAITNNNVIYSPLYNSYQWPMGEGWINEVSKGIDPEDFKLVDDYINHPYFKYPKLRDKPFNDLTYEQWLYGMAMQGLCANPMFSEFANGRHVLILKEDLLRSAKEFVEATIEIQILE